MLSFTSRLSPYLPDCVLRWSDGTWMFVYPTSQGWKLPMSFCLKSRTHSISVSSLKTDSGGRMSQLCRKGIGKLSHPLSSRSCLQIELVWNTPFHRPLCKLAQFGQNICSTQTTNICLIEATNISLNHSANLVNWPKYLFNSINRARCHSPRVGRKIPLFRKKFPYSHCLFDWIRFTPHNAMRYNQYNGGIIDITKS